MKSGRPSEVRERRGCEMVSAPETESEANVPIYREAQADSHKERLSWNFW
ncbi:hypothetical protein ES707_10904 [subsurface metagenome]